MLSKIEELALIARCVTADDRRAFGRLVEEYSPGLRHFVFNLTMGDAALTDDIAQEAFIKAYTGIRSFKGLSSFKTWLYRIACREYYSHVRRRQEESWEEAEATARGMADDSSDLMIADRRMDVERAMAELTEVERTLVLLFYYNDLPIKKVAAITELPEGTVKVYLSRARAKMATVLNEC